MGRNIRDFIRFPHSFERVLALGIAAGCSLNYFQSTLERVLTQPRNLMLWLILYGITARLSSMPKNAPLETNDPSDSTPRRRTGERTGEPTPALPAEPDPPQALGEARADRKWPIPSWADASR